MRLLRKAREDAGLGLQTAAKIICVSCRTLQRYEAKDEAPEDVILRMSEEYGCPELPFEFRSRSPIGIALEPMWLNSIDRNPGTMACKTEEEIGEVFEKRLRFTRAHMNKTHEAQFSKQDRELIDDFILELIDLINLVRSYMVWYARIFGLKSVKTLIRRYNTKCLDNGYFRHERYEKSALAEAL